jgi:hypothetical protein
MYTHSHSRAVLCSTPVNPSQQLLQELQQQLQLSILLPSVLLQWAVDHATCTSSDSYRMHSLSLMCEEADCLLDYYRKVLQDGPASLYQHMTGQVRPGAEASPGMGLGQGAAAQPQVRVCLPAEVYATQLQLLGSLLPNLLLAAAAAAATRAALLTLTCLKQQDAHLRQPFW